MPWGRIDDTLHSHPKWVGLSLAARGLWSTLHSYCTWKRELEGHVPYAVALLHCGSKSKLERLAAELVGSRMWDLIEGEWVFHNWHRYHPTSEEAYETINKRSEAGRTAGIASGEARRRKRGSTPPPPNDSRTIGERLANESFNDRERTTNEIERRANESRTNLNPIPIPIPLSERNINNARARGPETVTPTPCPDSLPDERKREIEAQAAMYGWPEPRTEWLKFRNHYRAPGTVMVDWSAKFCEWLIESKNRRTRVTPMQARAREAQREAERNSESLGHRAFNTELTRRLASGDDHE